MYKSGTNREKSTIDACPQIQEKHEKKTNARLALKTPNNGKNLGVAIQRERPIGVGGWESARVRDKLSKMSADAKQQLGAGTSLPGEVAAKQSSWG